MMLNCTANHLFDWPAGCQTVVHDTQFWRTLAKPPPYTNNQTTLRELPIDKLERLGEMLSELNNEN